MMGNNYLTGKEKDDKADPWKILVKGKFEWKNRWELKKLNIKPRLITKFKMVVAENLGAQEMQIGELKFYC